MTISSKFEENKSWNSLKYRRILLANVFETINPSITSAENNRNGLTSVILVAIVILPHVAYINVEEL
jgi:hypothetical protein